MHSFEASLGYESVDRSTLLIWKSYLPIVISSMSFPLITSVKFKLSGTCSSFHLILSQITGILRYYKCKIVSPLDLT